MTKETLAVFQKLKSERQNLQVQVQQLEAQLKDATTARALTKERGLECLHLVQLAHDQVDVLLQGDFLLLGNAVYLVHFQTRELLPRSGSLIFRGLNVRLEPAELLLCVLGSGLPRSLRLVQRLLGIDSGSVFLW
jgi:hypothetical protein